MSASDSTRRAQHTGLVTQQRRLRHLSSLSARNIVSDGTRKEKESLMETYFTLHMWPSLETVYTSEKIHNSLNPTWRSFDLQMSCPNLDTSKSSILVRLWGGQTADCNLVIEWLVDLRGLCFLGSQIHKDGVRYQPNSLIFGMFQGFYGAPDNLPDSSSISSQFKTLIEVEQSAAILSYKTFSLGRLHTTQRAIRQTEASVAKVRSSIVEKLTLARKKTMLHSEIEALKLRLNVLKYEQEQQEFLLAADCRNCTKSRESIDARAQDLMVRRNRLRSEIDELRNQSQLYQEKKEQLQKVAAKYTARKTTLLGELSDIYPVVELPNHEYTILGIKLPNAERYSGTDDMVVSTGLGHTCHLILMMSEILRLPLRYPMIHYGSRSLVRDHITESLAEKDRDFPLYSRGKERFQFNYALYLLNRNIAQLRFTLGLQTTDLRATLPNLKSMLALKWGIKNNAYSMIYQSPRALRPPGQADVSMQQQQQQLQQQQRPLPVSSTVHPQHVAPYPVQAPPVYSQVDSAQQPQHDTPPPPYQPVDAGQTPPPSPYAESNSPFEDLTCETEPAEPPAPSSPIPIPSVDMAAKAIEAQQAKLTKRRDSDERTRQTTAVIEAQVASLSLEDTLSDPGSIEACTPSTDYQEKENSWPSVDSLDANGTDTPEAHLLEPLDVEQVTREQEAFTAVHEDPEDSAELSSSPLDSLRTLTQEPEPEQEQDTLVLPDFAPSGQENASDCPSGSATVSANDSQTSPPGTDDHHNSGTESSQESFLPKQSGPREAPSAIASDTTQTPPQLPSSRGSPTPNIRAAHSMPHQGDEPVPKIGENSPSSKVTNLKHGYLVDDELFPDDEVLPRQSAALGIRSRDHEAARPSMDPDPVYQFDDLGSRAEALSRQDSFSSFRKISTSPGKGRKSGRV